MTETNLPLQNKVAIVTGASRGIGAAIAEALALRGAKVALTFTSDSSVEATEQLVKKIKGFGTSADAIKIQADLSHVGSPKFIVDTTIKAFGPTIHILINNAGRVTKPKPLGQNNIEDFNYSFDLNVRGLFFLTEAVFPHLPKKEENAGTGGRIINVGSVAERMGVPQYPIYSATKSTIEGFRRCWAAELGPQSHTVNQINPGIVETDMLNDFEESTTQFLAKLTPYENRYAKPQEIAEVVGFLVDDNSRWITGQVISASGGLSMY